MSGEKALFLTPGDAVFHPDHGTGIVMQVQITMVVVNWKQSNKIYRVKKSELSLL